MALLSRRSFLARGIASPGTPSGRRSRGPLAPLPPPLRLRRGSPKRLPREGGRAASAARVAFCPASAIGAAVIAVAILFVPRLTAQATEAGEQVIKAAYLYNFTKFIDWPESAFPASSAPFTVCIFADTQFRGHVTAIMEGEQVRGRPVVVKRPAALGDLPACHMAYFSRTDAERSGKHLAALRHWPTLTVGEGQRFMQLGGHIAFHREHDRVRFSVSRTRAEAALLNISSKLLRVAKDVE